MTTVVSVYMSPLAWSLLELGDKNLDVSIRAQELPFQAHPVHSVCFRLLGGSVERQLEPVVLIHELLEVNYT